MDLTVSACDVVSDPLLDAESQLARRLDDDAGESGP